jgi:hypothetical protein
MRKNMLRNETVAQNAKVSCRFQGLQADFVELQLDAAGIEGNLADQTLRVKSGNTLIWSQTCDELYNQMLFEGKVAVGTNMVYLILDMGCWELEDSELEVEFENANATSTVIDVTIVYGLGRALPCYVFRKYSGDGQYNLGLVDRVYCSATALDEHTAGQFLIEGIQQELARAADCNMAYNLEGANQVVTQTEGLVYNGFAENMNIEVAAGGGNALSIFSRKIHKMPSQSAVLYGMTKNGLNIISNLAKKTELSSVKAKIPGGNLIG